LYCRCPKPVDVKEIIGDAEPAADVKPVIEKKHTLVLGGSPNAVTDIGSSRFKDIVETEDVKPRGLGLLKNRRSGEQVFLHYIIIPRILNLYIIHLLFRLDWTYSWC